MRRREAKALDRFLDGAPVDDEPETDDEHAALAQAREAITHGETVDLDAARSELE